MIARERELREEECREYASAAHGVRLETVLELSFGSRKADDVHCGGGKGADDQEHVDTLRILAANVFGGPTIAMTFEVPKRFFNLHSHRVHIHNDTSRIRKRRGEDPRLASRRSPLAIRSASSWSSVTTDLLAPFELSLCRKHESARAHAVSPSKDRPQITWSATGKGMDVLKRHPSLPELHCQLATYASNEIPSPLLHGIKPLGEKSSVRYQNGFAARRNDRAQRIQEFALRPRAALALFRKCSREN